MSTASRADALERALAGSGTAPDDGELRRLVATAETLRTLPVRPPGPRPEFRESLQARLVEEARTIRPPQRAAPPVPVQRRRGLGATGSGRVRRVLAAAVAACLLGGTGAALASSTALPGQTLYPLKRGVEDVRLAVAGSDAARGATELDLARTRLDEAERLLIAADGGSPDRARTALHEFSGTTLSGVRLLLRAYDAEGNEAHLREVTTFLDATLPRLRRLQVEAPAELDPEIAALVSDLGSLQSRLDQVLAACAGPCPAPGEAAAGSRPGTGGAATPSPAGNAPAGAASAGSAVPVPPAISGAPTAGAPGDPPGAAVQVGGEAGVSAGSGGVAASLPGAGAQLPATTATAPGAVLPAPTVTVGDVEATVPGVTVDPGGLLAPGCTIDLSGTCLP